MAQDPNARSKIEGTLQAIRGRYGWLSDAELLEVRKGLEAMARRSEALRAVPLSNGDEPRPVFSPFRGQG